MLEPLSFLFLFIFGAIGGVLSGLLGIGGGLIYVMILNHYLTRYGIIGPEVVKFTLSNSILATFFAGATGTVKQIANKTYHAREVFATASAGMVSSSLITYSILHFNWYSEEKFSIFFLLVLLIFAYRTMVVDRKRERDAMLVEKPDWRYYSLSGLITGMVAALSGLGGGIVLIPLLTGLAGVNIKKASSISLGIIPFFAFANSVFYALSSETMVTKVPYSVGYIVLPIIVPMVTGVIVFTPVGISLSKKLSGSTIRTIFGVMILVIFLKMLYEMIMSKI